MTVALIILSSLLLIFTLLPITDYEVWWIRGLEFPRMQLFVLGVGLTLIDVFLLDFGNPYSWIILSAALGSTLYQCWWILPYTRIYPVEVISAVKSDPENTIRILVANVLQTNDCYQELLKMIREQDPHIFVTLESNQPWQQHLDQLADLYPHAIKCPMENKYGMHVYSKLPLSDSQIQFLVLSDIPSIHTNVTLISGVDITMHFMHPIPPRPSDTGESSQRDAELLVVGKTLVKHEKPVIVSGDLNDVAWSKTTRLFLKISRLLDPRVGRGMYNTFNAHHWYMRWPLDHLFHSNHFTLSRLQRLPKFGSDHFPVLVELVYDESKRKLQKTHAPNGKDEQLAQEKINSEGADIKDVHTPLAKR
jgi:endonuclease/exonuclease/phosphatase (EEP) superfamily protein YafD